MWTQFALTGIPKGEEWEPIKSTDTLFKCLNISNDLSFIDLPETKRMEFWDSLYQ